METEDLGWLLGLFGLSGGGGSGHHTGPPPSTVDTGYGNPDDTNGTDIFPPYVTQQSSDPGSLGESLGIPKSIPHGVWGIGPALGLPSTSCEFGACGGGFLNQTQINENKTLQQKIAELAAAGVFVGPFETKHSPFHKGQITLRDKRWFCSLHVALDQKSGSGGHPVTGEYHYDLYNPWSLIPASTFLHTLYDLLPDLAGEHFPGFPTGGDACR